MTDAPRIFSARTGRIGKAPSQIEIVEANITPEEIARRRDEQRKRELIDAGNKGFDITMPGDFDWETFAPWVVRVRDQTIWKRELGSPPNGYLPATHCVVVTDGGAWYYLTAAIATGPKAPRSVAELQERQEQAARKAAEQRKEQAKAFKARQATAVSVTLTSLDRHAPPTLREAVETVERQGGRVEVRGGRIVVSLPPGEVGVGPFGSEKPGGVAARVCYLAESELLATRRGDGRIDPAKVSAEPLLPSGRLAP
jgi:hypothetical protein